MIQISVDISDVTEKMDKMLREIHNVGISYTPDEFMTWQTHDMNRNRPNITRTQPTSYMTRFWRRRSSRPRSRIRVTPILRREMYDILRQRMSIMLQTKLTWR